MKHVTVTITARKNYYPDFHNSVNNFTYKIDTHDHVFILEGNKHNMAQIRDIMEKNVMYLHYRALLNGRTNREKKLKEKREDLQRRILWKL